MMRALPLTAGQRRIAPTILAAVTKLYAADAVLFGTAEPMIFDCSAPVSAHYSGLLGSGNTVRICERRVLPPLREDAVLLTGSYPSPPMSAYGTSRTYHHVRSMSAVEGRSDIQRIGLKGRE